MKYEHGRSLVEMLAYLALSAVILAGGWSVYRMIDSRISRLRAEQFFSDVAKDARLLYRDYSAISLDRMLRDTKKQIGVSPIGTKEYKIRSENLGKAFSINVRGINYSDCVYFATRKFDWATVHVNGYSATPEIYCLSTGDNELAFWVE